MIEGPDMPSSAVVLCTTATVKKVASFDPLIETLKNTFYGAVSLIIFL
jgi:hypothetical protein